MQADAPRPPRALDLSGSGVLGELSFLRGYTELDLANCKTLTDAGLEKIAAGCPQLASLNLHCYGSEVTDAGLEKIAAGCPQLASLDLSCCKQVTDAGLEKLAAGCPQLTSLNLFAARM